jgi:hypothetical protein
VAGALKDADYLELLGAAGFEAADIEVTRAYSVDDAKEFLANQSVDLQQLAQEVDGKFVSAFVRARKPLAAGAGDRASSSAKAADGACGCAPGCCGR